MSSDDSTPFRFPEGLHFVRYYPVEGDSAIAELMCGDDVWADLRLEGIDLTAVGAARAANARIVMRVCPQYRKRRRARSRTARKSRRSGSGESWEFEFDYRLCQELLARASDWLMENEEGRYPEPS
jgi:hypothetical protein